eukprot:TRINITY_DN1382_c0_g2_i2.p1 TRINITY_DN1382_c0_g2~~TRINITY_DN1382_c0_g2_i2.p1  ORF type:complete len:117 (+),score=12.08 TRINITY_DN1382_c0_g2_i2:67-417(+)
MSVDVINNGENSKVKVKGRKGESPLHQAAQHGQLSVVQLLINKGANENALDSRGRTPLDRAMFTGHLSVVQWMIQRGSHGTFVAENNRVPLPSDIVRWLKDFLQHLNRNMSQSVHK